MLKNEKNSKKSEKIRKIKKKSEKNPTKLEKFGAVLYFLGLEKFVFRNVFPKNRKYGKRFVER